MAARCLLFVPGNRPDRFESALRASPEGIIIDLEDAVTAGDKDTARANVLRLLVERPAKDGPPILIRINSPDTRAGLHDLLSLGEGLATADSVVLPKVEAPRDVALLRAHLARANLPILALVETAAGLDHATAIAQALRPGDALGLGGADLAADLGATLAWEPLLLVRSTLVLAARRRLALFDVPLLNRDPGSALAEEAVRVRALGYTGKLAIHPDQVGPIHAAFAPDADEITHARAILSAWTGQGVTTLDGLMIDAPVAAMARHTLHRAGLAS
ncbi:CoA ester lyase [Devosia ginsengisoli]|uniref:HpcH/HpaI aldolase/citrate lyase family protein n=1 Tax=Devosia ginsengisoli TaxID=400770 RepID=UPI0026ED0A54|nr:CoA ester lyase [Devosia ginsengisoli]MCR6670139.1 CoA ester lyase [Devosia ginsengisoli]